MSLRNLRMVCHIFKIIESMLQQGKFSDLPKRIVEDFRHVQSSDVRQVDPVLGVIFSTDEVTGLPNTDVAQISNTNTRPEVRQYIESKLMQPIPQSPRADSPDAAFDAIPRFGETLDAYGDRLVGQINGATEK